LGFPFLRGRRSRRACYVGSASASIGLRRELTRCDLTTRRPSYFGYIEQRAHRVPTRWRTARRGDEHAQSTPTYVRLTGSNGARQPAPDASSLLSTTEPLQAASAERHSRQATDSHFEDVLGRTCASGDDRQISACAIDPRSHVDGANRTPIPAWPHSVDRHLRRPPEIPVSKGHERPPRPPAQPPTQTNRPEDPADTHPPPPLFIVFVVLNFVSYLFFSVQVVFFLCELAELCGFGCVFCFGCIA